MDRITKVSKIISGGQTGADRGGLDAAMALGLDRGGWAPRGWRAEDGKIPIGYRLGMTERPEVWYRARTQANIESSDGTLILSFGPLLQERGSALTARLARMQRKPLMHIIIPTGDGLPPPGAELGAGAFGFVVDRTREWLLDRAIVTLNIAGPRESREPGLQVASRNFLVYVLGSR